MANDNGSKMASFLKNHPRLAGILFAALVALTQVGSAAAAVGMTID